MTIPIRITIIVIVMVIIANMVKSVKYSCVTRGRGRGWAGFEVATKILKALIPCTNPYLEQPFSTSRV